MNTPSTIRERPARTGSPVLIGTTTVLIPAGMAARIEAVAGLGTTRVEGNYARQENVYVSPDYETAPNRVDLQIRGGVGSITIRQFGAE